MKNAKMAPYGGFKAKWPTSCRSQEVGPRDFFVRLGLLDMRTKFCLPTTKLAERLSLWRCHGNGESEIKSFFDNY